MKKILILFFSIIFLSLLVSGVYATPEVQIGGLNDNSQIMIVYGSDNGIYEATQQFHVVNDFNVSSIDFFVTNATWSSLTIRLMYSDCSSIIYAGYCNLTISNTKQFVSCSVPNVSLYGGYNWCIGLSNAGINTNQAPFILSISDASPDNIQLSTSVGYFNLTHYSLNINISSQSAINITPSPTPTENTKSFIADLGDYFSSIFPSSSSLTTTEKFSFVFITILLTSLLVYFLAWKSTNKINGIVHFVVLILDIMLIFLFTAIGYIPLGIIIILVLILLIAAFFRFKSGGN